MKIQSALTVAFATLFLTACNDDDEAAAVTAESEPNDTFVTADNLGQVTQGTGFISITGDIDANDTGTGTDLEDHFLVVSNYDGQVQVTLTPTEVTSDVLVTEELGASTDGIVGNAGGAGAAEIVLIDCTSGVATRFRAEATVADTAYTLDVDPVAPLLTNGGPTIWVDQVSVDPNTGDVTSDSALIKVEGGASN